MPGRIATPRSVICALLILPAWALAAGCQGDTSPSDDGQGGYGGDASPSDGGQGGYGGEFSEVERELGDLRKRTKKLAKENSACSEDTECDAVPFGDKPCGGPWEYLPYSKTSEGADELLKSAAELQELEDQYNKDAGVLSDCALAIQPDTECASGTCVAVR